MYVYMWGSPTVGGDVGECICVCGGHPLLVEMLECVCVYVGVTHCWWRCWSVYV